MPSIVVKPLSYMDTSCFVLSTFKATLIEAEKVRSCKKSASSKPPKSTRERDQALDNDMDMVENSRFYATLKSRNTKSMALSHFQ